MTHLRTEKNETGRKGLVFSIQRYSIHDGPGIRTTVFFKGCPLRCKWCSNPESLNPYPEIMVREAKCNGCGKCLEICSREAIVLNNDSVHVDRSKCNLCMKCVDVCLPSAIEITGRYMNVEEVVDECSKDELFYRNSGGGVTLSGGEPLYQPEFALNLLRTCKEKGLSTAIDTSGYISWKVLDKVLHCTDLVLYDIKHIDSEMHYRGTGIKNDLILKNLKQVVDIKLARVWIRIPIIPNFNDSEQYIEKLAAFISEMPVEKISLLGYHEWGKPKYEFLGRDYPLNGSASLSQERLQSLSDIMQSKGLEVTVGY
ncbi:MAG: glycyl-radical enzyme activating protein [Chloroflexi bacterium]|nr:glycyl-radical enzyme activating protein [Chloroflexota bacterium]